jgi:hypothetical protein
MKHLSRSVLAAGLLLSLVACPADNALTNTEQSPIPSPVPKNGLSIEFQNQTYFESTIKAGVKCFQESGLDGAKATGDALENQLNNASNESQLEASLTGVIQVLLRSQSNFKLNCI